MSKKIAVIPERCSGCRLCELACSIKRFNVDNPKKSCVRVMVIYPHPVIRMPITCRQCKSPKCVESCPVGAISVTNGTSYINEELCFSCQQCVIACPFGAIFVHPDVGVPFKCDLCGGDPECVRVCPKQALLYVPEHTLGQAQRIQSVLRYSYMREVEYVDREQRRKLRYADQRSENGRDQERLL